MGILEVILLFLAFAFFVVATLIAPPREMKFACGGLACWVLSEIIMRMAGGGIH